MAQLAVRDLMATDIVTLEEDEDLDLAEQLMQLARIRHLPVVRDGDLVGLVTNRDLLRAQASHLAEPSAEQKKAMNLWVKAGWIMTRDVQTVEPDAPLLEAAHMLRNHKYGCLPVVEGGKLVGILTEDDFVRHTIHQLEDPRQ
ncbi:MAG: CBS domain-containing protein [Polyangiales bacterium]